MAPSPPPPPPFQARAVSSIQTQSSLAMPNCTVCCRRGTCKRHRVVAPSSCARLPEEVQRYLKASRAVDMRIPPPSSDTHTLTWCPPCSDRFKRGVHRDGGGVVLSPRVTGRRGGGGGFSTRHRSPRKLPSAHITFNSKRRTRAQGLSGRTRLCKQSFRLAAETRLKCAASVGYLKHYYCPKAAQRQG